MIQPRTAYIQAIDITKQYPAGDGVIYANRQVNFKIEQGEFVVILGPSGAGKSTLLNLLGGMDSATSGQLYVDGVDIAQLKARQLTAYRRTDVGFVFQFYNLVANLTTRENVELAADVSQNALPAEQVLAQVGLSHRLDHFPAQLSGGEQQRVAIARALVKQPKLLLCDEPTGALDVSTGKQVLEVLQQASRQFKQTVVLITHNAAIAPLADRVIHIHDAQVRAIEFNPTPANIAEIDW